MWQKDTIFEQNNRATNMPKKPNPFDKVLRLILRERNKTVIDCAQVLGVGMQHMHNYLNNPFKLTLLQLFTLAGFLNMQPVELFAMIHANAKSKEAKQQVATQIKNLSENTVLTPKDL